jgi:hypothetical protein
LFSHISSCLKKQLIVKRKSNNNKFTGLQRAVDGLLFSLDGFFYEIKIFGENVNIVLDCLQEKLH